MRKLIEHIGPFAEKKAAQATQAVIAVSGPTFLSEEAVRAPKRAVNGIEMIDMLPEFAPYTAEIPRETLQEVISRCEEEDVEAVVAELADLYSAQPRTPWPAILSHACGGVALEVGAGFGANTIELSKRFDRVIATDNVLERLVTTGLRLKALGITNVTLIRASAEKNPLSTGVADLIVCSGALETVGGRGSIAKIQQKVVASIANSLTETGTLFIGTTNRRGVFANALRRKGETHTNTPKRWRKILAEAGLRETTIWGTDDFGCPTGIHPIGERAAKKVIEAINRRNGVEVFNWRSPGCLLITASRAKQGQGVTGEALAAGGLAPRNVVFIDTASSRYLLGSELPAMVIEGHPKTEDSEPERIPTSSLDVLTENPGSPRRVRITKSGWEEAAVPTWECNGKAYSLEPYRDPETLSDSLPAKGFAKKALKRLRKFGPVLMRHLATEDRIWTKSESERLLLGPYRQICERIGNDDWLHEALILKASAMLDGRSLRFGTAHGNLTPETVYPEGRALVVTGWDHCIEDCPVAVDVLTFTFEAAARDDLTRLEKNLCRLKKTLEPEAFAARKALMAVALLNRAAKNSLVGSGSAMTSAIQSLLNAEWAPPQ